MAADADAAAGLDQPGVRGRELGKDLLVVAEPGAALRPLIDDVMRDEPAHLGVVVHLRRLVIVVLSKGAAIGHEQGGRVGDAGLRHQCDHVLIKRNDGDAVLVAAESVDHVRQVQLGINAALGGWHDAELLAGHHHPLALLPVAHHVGLEVVGAVVLLIPGDGVLGVRERLKIVVGEDPGAG